MVLTLGEVTRRISQAEEAIVNEKHHQAIAILKDIIKTNPNDVQTYKILGIAIMKTEKVQEALPYLRKAIELAPEEADSWLALGYCYKKIGVWDKAIDTFKQALKYSKLNTDIFFELTYLYQKIGKMDPALQLAKKIIILEPENINYLWIHARLLKEAGRKDESLKCYDEIVTKKNFKISADIISDRLHLMWDMAYIKEAREWMEGLSSLHPERPQLLQFYAICCERDLDFEMARTILEKSIKLYPSYIPSYYSLGSILKFLGEDEQSLYCFTKVLEHNRYATDILRMIGETHTYKYGDPYFQRLNYAAANFSNLADNAKVDLHFGLGRAYDQVGDLATAFEHYKKGGSLHLKGKVSESVQLYHLTEHIKQTLSQEYIRQNTIVESMPVAKPIFIVGMPRSGTSLIEQVITGIPGVFGAGEIPYMGIAINGMKIGEKRFKNSFRYPFSSSSEPSFQDRADYYMSQIERVAPPDALHIVDKMPTNFQWLGQIHLLFPHASIIHSRRHPVEICLSAYRLHFTEAQYWSYNLRDMGRYYRLYHDLMLYWKELLPSEAILDVRYEDMVNHLERESKKLAKHIGMEWDMKCLEFHTSDRAVKTASSSQVRQPLYKSSVNRWRKYEPYLKPLLDEIGDLVEAYETELADIGLH